MEKRPPSWKRRAAWIWALSSSSVTSSPSALARCTTIASWTSMLNTCWGRPSCSASAAENRSRDCAETTTSRPICSVFRYRRITPITGRLLLVLGAREPPRGRALLGHDPPRDRDEARVRHHPVERTHRLAFDVPRAEQRLERLDEAPRRVRSEEHTS